MTSMLVNQLIYTNKFTPTLPPPPSPDMVSAYRYYHNTYSHEKMSHLRAGTVLIIYLFQNASIHSFMIEVKITTINA